MLGVVVDTAVVSQRRAIVLDHVRVIDGTGTPPVAAGRVVVEGDRIVAVGAEDSVPLPAVA